MPDTTYEEARRCYKCGEPAMLVKQEIVRKLGVKRGTEIHTFRCMNPRCRMCGENVRTIQVNPDGSIPQPRAERQKMFPELPDRTEEVRAAIDRQILRETKF